MKLIAALLISTSVFFGVAVSGVAGLTLTTPGTCVEGPAEATGGAVTAFTNVSANTMAPPLEVDFSTNPC